MYVSFFKRVIDLVVAIILFILLSPFFLLITIALLIVTRANPFFFQVRPGKAAHLFKLIKFKTMTEAKDQKGELLPDAERFTGIGKFLRKTSLDEVPQLLNVIKGEMSLVGPRPLLVEYLPLYNKNQVRRHEVLPGITGWAQANGRNTLSWERKFEYDIWYVDHISFQTDIKILFLTIKKVIKREGINSGALITMEKFSGNENKFTA